MKKFNYRLERILQYKLQVEEQRRRELTERIDELNIQNNLLIKLTRDRESYLSKYSAQFRGHIDVTILKNTRRYLDKLHRELVLQAKKVIEAEKKVEKVRAVLLEAMKDRKKYENLKARKLKSYTKEINLAEQKTLDEFGSQAFSRKSSPHILTASID
jgi:flagellar protein FliJ